MWWTGRAVIGTAKMLARHVQRGEDRGADHEPLDDVRSLLPVPVGAAAQVALAGPEHADRPPAVRQWQPIQAERMFPLPHRRVARADGLQRVGIGGEEEDVDKVDVQHLGQPLRRLAPAGPRSSAGPARTGGPPRRPPPPGVPRPRRPLGGRSRRPASAPGRRSRPGCGRQTGGRDCARRSARSTTRPPRSGGRCGTRSAGGPHGAARSRGRRGPAAPRGCRRTSGRRSRAPRRLTRGPAWFGPSQRPGRLGRHRAHDPVSRAESGVAIAPAGDFRLARVSDTGGGSDWRPRAHPISRRRIMQRGGYLPEHQGACRACRTLARQAGRRAGAKWAR